MTRPEQPWLDAVAALWPGHAILSSPGRHESAGLPVRELAFLPRARGARLLVPVAERGAAAGAVRRYSSAVGPFRRLARWGGALGFRGGAVQRVLTDRVLITGVGGSVEEHLSGVLGREVVVSVGLGSERANRKPVLQALTPAGTPAAFVKVGDSQTSRELIEAEATALGFLAGHRLTGIAVPQVLWHGPWHGLRLLVLSALPASGWRPRGRVPRTAMAELFAVAGTVRKPLAGSGFWTALRTAPVSDPERARSFTEAVNRSEARSGDAEITFGAWHGDWTPWNMAWHRGTVQLWDWERFSPEVPAGFDEIHFRSQARGRPGADELTQRLYLLELCRRYLLAAQAPAGEPLRARADELLRSLP